MATPNTLIQGTITPTDLAETDGSALIAGGCTTMLEGVSFTLTQGNPTFTARRHDRSMAIYTAIKSFHRH